MHLAWRHAAWAARWSLAAAALALAGCASAPRSGTGSVPRPASGGIVDPSRDGPEASPPAGLEQVPDAEPRIEAIRVGGPNKPYEALGREYVPMTQDRPYAERGLASWYGRKFHGKRTSSGEPYDMYAMTAAHPTLPIPSYVHVRNPANGREVVVRINDRGPFHPGRIIDLSYTAALKLDLLRGVAPVEVERITFDDIRAGTWRRGAPDDVRVAARGGGSAPSRAEPVVPSGLVAPVAQTRADAVAPARGEGMAAAVAAAPAPASAATLPGASTQPSAPTASAAPAMPSPPPTPATPATTASVATVATLPAPAAAPPTTSGASAAPVPGYWIQLGVFRQKAGADAFQRRVADELAWLSPRLSVWDDASLYRLQAGPYPSRDEARGAADSIRSALQLVPVIVERR